MTCHLLPVVIPAPIQTTSTLYERGFEKIMKRQNKEQVPPPAAESKKPVNKKQPKKVTAVTSQNQKQGPFRCPEDALKAVSGPRLGAQRKWGLGTLGNSRQYEYVEGKNVCT